MTASNSFATYRQEFSIGQDGWLTASLSARDRDKNGIVESPPSITKQPMGDGYAAVLDVPDHTGGAMPFDPNGAIYWKGRYHLFYIFQDIRWRCRSPWTWNWSG